MAAQSAAHPCPALGGWPLSQALTASPSGQGVNLFVVLVSRPHGSLVINHTAAGDRSKMGYEREETCHRFTARRQRCGEDVRLQIGQQESRHGPSSQGIDRAAGEEGRHQARNGHRSPHHNDSEYPAEATPSLCTRADGRSPIGEVSTTTRRAGTGAGKRVVPNAHEVFVNAPFDDQYLPLLKVLLFTIHACGFAARTALEDVGANEQRLHKIQRLIEESRLSVHDISRIELDGPSKLPRFNMPFELGLAMGAARYGQAHSRDLLVLCKTRHQDKVSLSDLAGQDARPHNEDPKELMKCVRTFLAAKSKGSVSVAGGEALWKKYEAFERDLPAIAIAAKLTLSELNTYDYLDDWLHLAIGWLVDVPPPPVAAKKVARKVAKRI